MSRNKYLLGLLTIAFTCFLGQAIAADKPDGTWTWSVPGRNGGDPRTSTLKLKSDGDKLTGKISSPGRQGGEARETDIEDGKIKGDEVSFKVVREFNGNKFTSKYNGKVSGDTIKGKVEIDRGQGDPMSRDWEAKRSTDKK
jgi:hypothetical protein